MPTTAKSNNKVTGNLGEDIAAATLEKQGYTIVTRNYRRRYGEIDLIVKKGNRLYFVEVKARKSRDFGNPLESITPRKQKIIYRVAQGYLQEHPACEEMEFGFLGVGILFGKNGEYHIEIVEDYFM